MTNQKRTAEAVFKELADLVGEVPKIAYVDGPEVLAEMIARFTRQLQIQRARLVADVHYLGGESQRSIGRRVGVTGNAVNLWLKQMGPKHYVVVRSTKPGFTVETVPAKRDTDEVLEKLAQQGYRIAPATMRLDELDVNEINGRALWTKLGDRTPVGVRQA